MLGLLVRSKRVLFARPKKLLGVRFPPTYRAFLRNLGAGSVAFWEFYGIVSPDRSAPSVPNGIWVTKQAQRAFSLPESFVVVGDTGMGEFYVLPTAQGQVGGDCPVVVFEIGADVGERDLAVAAADFGSFVLAGVREATGTQEWADRLSRYVTRRVVAACRPDARFVRGDPRQFASGALNAISPVHMFVRNQDQLAWLRRRCP
jgi:hypothetical protein